MVILGIYGDAPQPNLIPYSFSKFHDSNASLIKDEVYLGSAQEERFTRKKYDGQFPFKSITSLLENNNLNFDNVDLVYCVLNDLYINPKKFEASEILQVQIKNIFKNCNLKFVDHHTAHSMSAFLTSNFNESNLLSLDGAGSFRIYPEKVLKSQFNNQTKEINYGFFGEATKNSFNLIKWKEFNHIMYAYTEYDKFGNFIGYYSKDQSHYTQKNFIDSIGNLYFIFSNIIFKKLLAKYDIPFTPPTNYDFYEGISGKIMGLKGYGKFISSNIPQIISVERNSSYEIPQFYYNYDPKEFCLQFLDNHEPEDLAFWLQQTFEDIVIRFLKLIPKHYKKKNLCFSGGCALNILLNERILKEKIYDNLHVHPSTSDAGLSLGAALLAAKENNLEITLSKNIGCVGAEYSEEKIKKFIINNKDKNVSFFDLLNELNLKCKKYSYEEIYEFTSEALSLNKIVGWFQGKSEYGPRALGNRSILANPSFNNSKLLNEKVKHREFWRPYAAVVMEEYQNDWFNISKNNSYYMLFGGSVKDEMISIIPGVTHVDKTCRIQTVNKEMNEHLYLLLKNFYGKTKIPVLLNTSFNTLKGEPIVETPVDAVRSFVNSKIDLLIINNMIITKETYETHNGETFPVQTN